MPDSVGTVIDPLVAAYAELDTALIEQGNALLTANAMQASLTKTTVLLIDRYIAAGRELQNFEAIAKLSAQWFQELDVVGEAAKQIDDLRIAAGTAVAAYADAGGDMAVVAGLQDGIIGNLRFSIGETIDLSGAIAESGRLIAFNNDTIVNGVTDTDLAFASLTTSLTTLSTDITTLGTATGTAITNLLANLAARVTPVTPVTPITPVTPVVSAPVLNPVTTGQGAWAHWVEPMFQDYKSRGLHLQDMANAASAMFHGLRSPEEWRMDLLANYGVPAFAVGTNYVPDDMLANIHQGERIIPAADNAELMERLRNPQARDAALLAELKALRAEVAALRTENSAENNAIASNTRKTADKMQKFDADGMPAVRT